MYNTSAARLRAAQLATSFGLEEDITAGEVLIRETRRIAGSVTWLWDQVRQLEIGQFVWGDAEKVMREGGNDAALELTQKAGINVWLMTLQAQQRTQLDYARSVVAMNIDQRLVQLEELKAAAFVRAIDLVLDALELTDSQRTRALLVVPAALERAAGEARQPGHT